MAQPGTNTTVNDDNDTDLLRVHAAVARGASQEELQSVLDEVSQGDAARRAAAANKAAIVDPATNQEENPLQAAHRLRRGDLIGVLLIAGADTELLSLPPLSLCIAYGLAAVLESLLQSGAIDPNEDLPECYWGLSSPDWGRFCTPAHMCLCPPPLFPPQTYPPPPQLECLRVLREGGLDLEQSADDGTTALTYLFENHVHNKAGLARILVQEFGANVDGLDGSGETALHRSADDEDLVVLLVDELGASTDVVDRRGRTPVMRAAEKEVTLGLDDPPFMKAILSRTSLETRRRVNDRDGRKSVLDYLILGPPPPPHGVPPSSVAEELARLPRRDASVPFLSPSRREMVLELMASEVSFQPTSMMRVAAHGIRLDKEMVASGMGPGELLPEEQLIGLAFDHQELREAEAAKAASATRLAELESERRALGVSTDTESGEEDEGEKEEEEDEEMGESAAPSAGGEEGDDEGAPPSTEEQEQKDAADHHHASSEGSSGRTSGPAARSAGAAMMEA